MSCALDARKQDSPPIRRPSQVKGLQHTVGDPVGKTFTQPLIRCTAPTASQSILDCVHQLVRQYTDPLRPRNALKCLLIRKHHFWCSYRHRPPRHLPSVNRIEPDNVDKV